MLGCWPGHGVGSAAPHRSAVFLAAHTWPCMRAPPLLRCTAPSMLPRARPPQVEKLAKFAGTTRHTLMETMLDRGSMLTISVAAPNTRALHAQLKQCGVIGSQLSVQAMPLRRFCDGLLLRNGARVSTSGGERGCGAEADGHRAAGPPGAGAGAHEGRRPRGPGGWVTKGQGGRVCTRLLHAPPRC